MKRAGKRIRRALSALLLALVLTVGISAAVRRVSLKTTEYTAAVRGLTAPVRTVVLSDLHSREYGKDNAALLARVAQQQPDAIFCVGDFIDSDAAPAQLQRLYQLLRRLGEIAPVFFSPGNHEIAYMESHGSELLDAVAATGATVLYDRWVQTTLGDAAVRIGGSCGHFRDINRSAKLDYAMEETIGAADVPGIVLLHMPESLLLDDARERWTGQVFLSGHTHGGVIAFVSERSYGDLQDLLANARHGDYFVCLDGIEDPFNFGYAVRVLYAMGCKGFLLPKRNWSGAAGITARASAGATELCEMAYLPEDEQAVRIFRENGVEIVCSALAGNSEPLNTFSPKKPFVLFIGGEKRGISPCFMEAADKIVHIPYVRSAVRYSLPTATVCAMFAARLAERAADEEI